MRKGVGILLFTLALLSLGFGIASFALDYQGEKVESEEARPSYREPVVEVVAKVGDSVVRIETVREVTIEQFFFQSKEERTGVGSGVVYREDGYILTNDHVVADSKELRVRFRDGRSFLGTVIGRDPLLDLAVIRVEATGLTPVVMQGADELRVGQSVIAIGNPLGQDYSVTTGIISALNRDLLVDPKENRYLEQLIQTDALIHPGNSGGPLLDLKGGVIGINTAMIKGAPGLGFAIPSSQAGRVADQLLEHGRPLRLGILGGSLTPALVATLQAELGIRLFVNRGAYITSVLDDSAALRATLQAGDVIVAVNGKEIAGMREVRDEVQKVGFGGTMQIAFYRGSERLEVKAELS